MKKKIRISLEKIICKNSRNVYFVEDGKIFRGNRKVQLGSRGSAAGSMNKRPFVVEATIKQLTSLPMGLGKTTDILEKYAKIHGCFGNEKEEGLMQDDGGYILASQSPHLEKVAEKEVFVIEYDSEEDWVLRKKIVPEAIG